MAEDSHLSPAEFGTAFKQFMESMEGAATPAANPVRDRVRSHLGGEPAGFAVVTEEFERFDHPNLQVALEERLAVAGRTHELVGVAVDNRRFMGLSLSDLLAIRHPVSEGPPDYVNVHLEGDRVLPCLQFGLHFLDIDGNKMLVLVSGPSDRMGPMQKVRLEVMATNAEAAQALLAEVSEAMRRLNVYRGRVISVSPAPMSGLNVEFHGLPPTAREDLVLPNGLLERIERQTVAFTRHADRLLAQGRALKRGILLFGVPGTGKTLTVRYLTSAMPERTVLLATGRGLGMVQTVCRMARTLEPSMVVMEDVDLVAEMRGQPMMPSGPLLFELLNEMDGLRPEADVIFVLTTNRPDILEPALASRPGRVDLVAELPLPDAEARRRLIQIYARGLPLGGADVAALVESTDGVSPAYIKELLRRAALIAAEQGTAEVGDVHLRSAMAELDEGGRLAQRLLGFRPQPEADQTPPDAVRLPPTGFPTVSWRIEPS